MNTAVPATHGPEAHTPQLFSNGFDQLLDYKVQKVRQSGQLPSANTGVYHFGSGELDDSDFGVDFDSLVALFAAHNPPGSSADFVSSSHTTASRVEQHQSADMYQDFGNSTLDLMSTEAISGPHNAKEGSATSSLSSPNGESEDLLDLGERNDVSIGAGCNANATSQHHQHDAVDDVTGLPDSEKQQKHEKHQGQTKQRSMRSTPWKVCKFRLSMPRRSSK